jgi:hypothetical protein
VAFTNPILAGEELNRTGIRSENYIPGVSGWRIANDGAAEFDNIGLRNNLWAPSITLNGQDLASRLDALPKGVVAFITGYPVVSTTTEAQVMSLDCDIVNGRYYEAFLTNLTTDIQTGADSVEFKFRWTLGNPPPAVTTSSDIIANGLRQSIFNMTVLRHAFWSGATTRMRLACFMASLNAANVRTWAPGTGCTLAVVDHGAAPYAHPGQGVVGTGAPTRVLKEWTITANNNWTFHGDGVRRTDARINDLVAGDWENGRGNQRAWWTFSSADATKLDELIGVPAADVVTAEVYLWNLQWRSLTDDGYVSLGFHNTNDLFLYYNEPGGGIPNVHRPYVSGGGGWFSIHPSSGAPSNFLDSMRDGYLNGFMVGNTFFGQQYCGVFDGYDSGAAAPKLHMKYWKNV